MPNKDIPNVSDLISMPSRYYIKPIDEKDHQSSRFGAHDSSIDDGVDSMKTASAPALDLGTAALQRIVTNMKSINFENDDKSFKFNPEAARLAGLCSYTEFTAAPHQMRAWKSKHSLHKDEEKLARGSSMYVGSGDVGSTRRGRTL